MTFVSRTQFHVAVVAAFHQEKSLVGAFSVIMNLRMDLFEALVDITQSAAYFVLDHVSLCVSAGLRML